MSTSTDQGTSGSPKGPSRGKRLVLRLTIALGLALFAGAALFAFNGLVLGHGENVLIVETKHPAKKVLVGKDRVVKVLAYNLAKGFAYHGGLTFEHPETLTRRMDGIAELIRHENPDMVFLSEAVLECTPAPVNQVEWLAEKANMHQWAFGENYNIGLPFYRVIGGNAILSRWPLEVVANPSLSGRKPFYVSKNNRRVLWCAVNVNGERLLVASIHNDSFNIANNLKQVEQILDFAGDQDALLAGDFNARPEEEPMKRLKESHRFTGNFDGPKSFPADEPDRRIDFILAPRSWELLEERVLETELSDHRPVVATFRLPG